jgi:hypothetical protein
MTDFNYNAHQLVTVHANKQPVLYYSAFQKEGFARDTAHQIDRDSSVSVVTRIQIAQPGSRGSISERYNISPQ